MPKVQDVKAKGAPLEAGAGKQDPQLQTLRHSRGGGHPPLWLGERAGGVLPWLWFLGLSSADGGSILGGLRGAAVLLIGLLLGFPAGGQAQTTITAERYNGTTWESVTSGSENVRLTRLTGSGHTISATSGQLYTAGWCLRTGVDAGTASYNTFGRPDWGFLSRQSSAQRNSLVRNSLINNDPCTDANYTNSTTTVERWLDITDDDIDEPDETIRFSFNAFRNASGSANFEYTIRDNDPTIVSLAKVGSATTITEEDSLRFTVTLGRELVAGEVIDVPLSISGMNVTTEDWSLSLVPGSILSGINTGVTLSGASTATPKLTFSGKGAQVATLEWTATAENPSQTENPETVTIALGPDGSGTNGFDRTTLGTNVGGGANPHGTNNQFSITVEDLGLNPLTWGWTGNFNTDTDAINERGYDELSIVRQYPLASVSGYTLPQSIDDTTNGNFTFSFCVRTGDDAGTATYSTDWVFTDFLPSPATRLPLIDNCNTTSLPFRVREQVRENFGAAFLITDDTIDEPDETVKITFVASDGATGTGNFEFIIEDNDPTIVSLESPYEEEDLTIKEGNVIVFQVTLGRELVAGEVVVMSLPISGTNVTTGDWNLALLNSRHGSPNTGITLSDATTATPKLTFAGAGAQTATLRWTATPDKTPESPEIVTIALGSAQEGTNVGGGANPHSNDNRFSMTVEDPSILIAETDGATSVTEAAGEGRADTYTVVAGARPSHGVEVTVESSDRAVATVSPATLSFTTGNWNTAQTVTVTAVDDHLDQGNRTVTISHASTSTDPDFHEGFINSVTATVVDDDRAGLTITHSGGSTTVTEAAGATRTDTYTVALSSEPTHGVELTLSAWGSAVAMVSPTSLSFTTSNWNTAQTVTVTGMDDNVDQGGFQRSPIVTVATTEDSKYASVFLPFVMVTVVDDDTAGVTITESGGSTAVTEAAGAGNTDTYTVVLDTKPRANVEVEVDVVAYNREVATVSPATLSFTTSNWNTAQTVTVTGVDDNVDQPGNRRLATITNRAFSSGRGGDRRYDRIPIPNTIVTVVDDDGDGVTIIESMGATLVTEASGAANTDTYTVVLNGEPGADVEIAVTSGDTGAATVSPATLTFTTSNWNIAQTVTVTGVDNTVARDTRSAAISHTATSTDIAYSGIIIDIVTATVVDDDGTGATINESNGSTSVTEASGAGNTDTYTVVLDTRPSASVEIAVASDMAAATVSPATLTFTTSNWNTAQTVTVTGVDDNTDQTGKRSATISHTATSTDANYEGVHIDDVAVAVVDDDGAGVTIIESNGSTSVTETFGLGNTDTYMVVLDSPPAGTVAIHVTSNDPSLVTASPATLTFTTTNYNTAQTVTVTGVDDDDTQTGNSIAVISHVIITGDGGDYSRSRTIEAVRVTLIDDDLPVISITLPNFEGLSRRGGLYYFPEGEGLVFGAGFNISASPVPTQDLTICLNLTETGANRMVGAGDQGKGPITFTLPANTASGDQRISWSDNNDDDQNSLVTLAAVPPSGSNCSQTGYTVSLTEDSQSWFIEDDEPTGVNLTSSDTRMSEGNASATAMATITLSRPLLSGEMINLPLTLTTTTGAGLPGSATPDFTVSATGTGVTNAALTSATPTVILAGSDSQTVQTALVTFTPTSRDDGDSSHEAINVALPSSLLLQTTQRTLSLSNLGGRATRGENFDVDLTLEDDEAPTVQFGSPSYSGGEASGSRTVNVGLTASPVFSSATSVTYDVGGTATSGTDYTALSGTVSVTGGSGTITITITDDQVDDADETIVLTLTPSNNYSLGSQESTTITIADDDAPAVNIMETDGSTSVLEEARSGVGNDTYMVVLNSPPTHDVEISATSGDTAVATMSPATLTFTTSNWNTAQTVTVTGVDNDRFEDNRIITISHSATSSDTRYNGIDIDDVTVTVREDELVGLSFNVPGPLSVTEASGASQTYTYTVALRSAPTANVTITPTSLDTAAATVSPDTLTFTSSTWNTRQTLTLTGVDDNVDQSNDRTVYISHHFSSTDPFYKKYADTRSPITYPFTVVDDDTSAVTIAETDGATTLEEGGQVRNTDTYTVVLDTLPSASVEIAMVSDNTAAATVSPATLTFTTGNWNTAQTVTVTGVDDDVDTADRSATISHSATSTDAKYNDITIASVTATVEDDDAIGYNSSTDGSTSVTEASGAGRTDTYTMDLRSQPTANVTIAPISPDTAVATVSPATLTFTTGNWNTAQTVTVTGVDDDVDQSSNRMVIITHTMTSTDPLYRMLGEVWDANPITVTVVDDDVAAVPIAETNGATSVSEASGVGNTDTYTVVLDTLPSASVEIAVASGDTAAAMVSPSTLTFTTGNWNTAQTVTVTGVNDHVDNTNDARSATISHTATSTDAKYNRITIASVTAVVVDDDTAGVTIAQTNGSTLVTEAAGAGRTDTYTVELSSKPTASVTITMTLSGDTAAAMVSSSTLTFTTGNWNTAQTVTVTGVDDNIDQSSDRRPTISHSATSADAKYRGITIASVTARVVDNDGAGVTVNEFDGVSVTEAAGAGRTDTYTVRLVTQPTASVTIAMTSSGDTDAATVSPATLTFTTGNWNTAQTVTVTGVDDNVYQSGDRRITISHSASSSDSIYHGITIASVTATVVDDDTATIGIGDSGGVSVTETSGAGNTDTYTVVLDSRPSASVEIAVASGDTGAATVSPAVLTFTTGNWNTVQTVTVTGVDDNIDQSSDRTVDISHTATSSDTGYNGVSASVTVTVVDDDTASIAINESGGVMVTEATGTDHTDTYTAMLGSEPTASVEIIVTSGDGGAATVSPAALTFTASNWQTAQTVTVTGVDDKVDQSSDRMVAISHSATSTDTGYDGLSASVTATVVDNDTAGVTITESGNPPATSVDEFIGGLTDTYTLALDSEPTASVEITVTSGDMGAGTVSPATLTFTASNWQSAQTVTVTGVDDGIDQSNDRAMNISHSATSTDLLYNGIGIDDVTVTVVDDDMVGVIIIETDGATMVTEASGAAHTDHYTVALGNRPTSTVTITMGLNAPGAVTVSPTTLTFTTSSWKTAQTVTVTAVDDEVDQEERRTVSITHPLVSSDVRYSAIPTPRITAIVVDNDGTVLTFGLSVDDDSVVSTFDNSSSASDLISDPGPTVTEAPGPAHTDTYTLALTAWPEHAKAVSVAMVSSDPGAATVGPVTLTFIPSNWDTPQTVTVTGVDDGVDQSGNRTVTITHTPTSDSGRRIPTRHALVTVMDNDTEVSITADDHDGTITEGEAARFTLTATPAPAAEQTIDVNVRITDSGRFAVSSQIGNRVFTITESGTVSFSIPTEDDMNPEGDGRITATVETGRGYRPHSSNASASITVEDDFDAPPSVIPSTDMLTVAEGGTASYTIMLDGRPASGVAVSISARGEDGTVLISTATSLGRSPRDGSSGVDGEAVVSVNPILFTFRPTDWSTPQAVAITVPAGAGLAGETITLSHTVRRGNHQGPMTDVLVRVTADAALVEKRKRAWHLRFGRTVSQQVVDALQQRLTTPPEAGLQLTVAGETVASPTTPSPLAEHEGLLAKALGFNTVTLQALVEGSSFKFAPPQERDGPRPGFWGQGALSSFDGEEDEFSLDGDVTTLLLGADWSTGRWQAGAALSQSWGSGSYEGDNHDIADGRISSVLTGLFPYGRYALTPRLGFWTTAGYGWGELSLEPDEEEEYSLSTTMAMTAAGLDGALLDGDNGAGITLNATADVMTVKTTSEEADGLPSSEGALSRLRLGLEAARPFPLPQGASLLPSMEVGMRYDSGDAETGYGLDLGAGILWNAPEYGISGELKGHTLLTHGEEEFREQGLALSFSWEPDPSDRGPSLSLSHTMGATASGGMDALLNPTTIQVLDASPSTGQEFSAELAYGFTAHQDRITLTPAVALALSPTTRNYSLLWSVAPYGQHQQGAPWELSLEGERQEQQNSSSPVDYSLKLRFSTLF